MEMIFPLFDYKDFKWHIDALQISFLTLVKDFPCVSHLSFCII